jgi:hypothetical protein
MTSEFKNLNERGTERPPDEPVPLEVWHYVIDPATGKETGYVRRDRMRTYGEVFNDLNRHMDTVHCSLWCGYDVPRRETYGYSHDWVDDKCPKCGDGELESFIDEYLSCMAPYTDIGKKETLPVPKFCWPCAWPVVGGSEGHYVHIGGVTRGKGQNAATYHDLALAKTFQGWDHALRIANRASSLLWGEKHDCSRFVLIEG